MIPINITIEGFYSYQKSQTIAFERLTQAEVFGIFGATGSGKSSILEAIFFCLYGKSERLGGDIPGSKAYQMMNLKSKRLYIDFQFANSEQGNVYRFSVEGKRNNKVFEKTQPLKRNYYQKIAEEWVPLESPDVEKIVGLTYDNFKRTIIIPQGKFQEFIHLKDAARSEMLEQIFDLKRFDLAPKVKSLKEKNNVDLGATEARLLQYQAVTQEVIEAQNQEIQSLEGKQKLAEAELKTMLQKQEQMRQLQEKFARQAQLEKTYEELMKDKSEIEARRQRLETYIQCLEQFDARLKEYHKLTQQVGVSEKKVKTLKEDQEKRKQDFDKKRDTFQRIEKTYQERDSLQTQAKELQTILELGALHKNIEALNERIQNGQLEIAQIEKEKAQHQQTLEAENQQIDVLEKKLQNDDELRAVQNWFTQKKFLTQQAQRLLQQKDKIKAQIDQAKKEKQQLLTQTSLDPRQFDQPIKALQQLLQNEKIEWETSIQQKESQIQSLLVKQQLQEFAVQLEDGAPCPLCGSQHHPDKFHNDQFQRKLKKLQTTLTQEKSQRDLLQGLIPKIEHLVQQALQFAQEQKSVNTEMLQLEQEQTQHQGEFIWKAFEGISESDIQEEITSRKKDRTLLQEKKTDQKALQATLSNLDQKAISYTQKIIQLQNDERNLSGKFEAGFQQLTVLSYEEIVPSGNSKIQQQIQDLLAQYEGIETTYKSFADQLKQIEKNLHTLTGQLHSEQQHVQSLAKQTATLFENLNQEIEQSKFASIHEIKAVLDQPIHIERERKAIDTFDQQLTACQTSIQDLQEEIGDQEFNPEEARTLDLAIAVREKEMDTLKQKIGGLIEKIKWLSGQLEEKYALEKQVEKLQLRKDNLKILEQMFKGKGFVKYVSTMYLENLCAAANTRFTKLTRNALSLEIDEHNHFHVRDLLNGAKRRSIKTLSGGQTFQAALCLALALSDQVQQRAKADQHFFFLDEGFGSQDKDALQIIMQTLKALRKENRIVGLISHVEELQQDIQTYLHIENDPEEGSLVKTSWQ
ncbi:MAG: SMC family ATPase [Bacteroidota bacterium]